jgi:hypothetical protein
MTGYLDDTTSVLMLIQNWSMGLENDDTTGVRRNDLIGRVCIFEILIISPYKIISLHPVD